MFFLPLPSMTQEFLPGDCALFNTLSFEFGHYLGFGSYGCVVGSRNPASIFPGHPGSSYQYILYCIIEHMAHVEHTGYIGRRDHYCVRLPVIGFRMEVTLFHPISVPFVLSLCRRVFSGYFHIAKSHLKHKLQS
ncbi:hypothetical protein SDC9_106154 [bioreactor metagenome]|uniref:Uncharacterized protein n=1 Tax=bioreactor metagenome TaxID=1076179 RepID=A0A645BC75_9ZZZZ